MFTKKVELILIPDSALPLMEPETSHQRRLLSYEHIFHGIKNGLGVVGNQINCHFLSLIRSP